MKADPVSIKKDLLAAAEVAAKMEHRTPAEQLEYWASIGHKVARFVGHGELLKVDAGLAVIKVVRVTGRPVDPDAVFAGVEAQRISGDLSQRVTSASPIYQASATHPGYLEQIDKDGNRSVGAFQNGVFMPIEELEGAI